MKKAVLLLLLAFGMHRVNAQALSLTINHTDVTCNGVCNGTADAVPAGGTPAYSYLWNPGGQTTQSLSNLCAGTYTCTVTDQVAGTATATVTITQPTPITISFGSTTNATCYGSC